MFIQRSPWPQSHTPEDVRFSALTAAPAGGKLTLPRFGEALTLRVSPRGFLKRQRGATFGPPLPLCGPRPQDEPPGAVSFVLGGRGRTDFSDRIALKSLRS
jgi:hypothetical protein